MTTIVFLHIPKTAGQAVNEALHELVGGSAFVSPVRVHTQAAKGPQMPPGYSLYSGHIDWTELESLPPDRFAFTVLRDPRERIASFYFYMRAEAKKLSGDDLDRPENRGKRMVLERSADDYFFGGDANWQNFVQDHYNNFYVSYLATRQVRGRKMLRGISEHACIERALAGAACLQAIYTTETLNRLEQDLGYRYHANVTIANRGVNIGQHNDGESRWTKLLTRLEQDGTATLLERWVAIDEEIFAQFSTPTGSFKT